MKRMLHNCAKNRCCHTSLSRGWSRLLCNNGINTFIIDPSFIAIQQLTGDPTLLEV